MFVFRICPQFIETHLSKQLLALRSHPLVDSCTFSLPLGLVDLHNSWDHLGQNVGDVVVGTVKVVVVGGADINGLSAGIIG